MRFKIIVYVLLVVLLLVVGYWAVIGFADPLPDADDNLEAKDYDYYATFRVAFHIISQSADGIELTAYVGSIDSVEPTVSVFESLDQGKVYEMDKLFKLHPRPGVIYGTYWFTIEVTGPGGYLATWKSAVQNVIGHTESHPQYGDYPTGRFLMKESGTYQVSVILYSTTGPNDIARYLDRYTAPLVVG